MKSEELRKISHNSAKCASENYLKDIDKVIKEITPKILKMFDNELLEMAQSGKMVYTLEQTGHYRQPIALFEQTEIGALDPVYWECLFTPEFNELLTKWVTINEVYMTVLQYDITYNGSMCIRWKIKADIRKHRKIYQLWRKINGKNKYLNVSLASKELPYYVYRKFKRQEKQS